MAKKTIKDVVREAIEEWARDNTEEKIRLYTRATLDKRRGDLVAKLAGFDSRWDKWEVDHCNARRTPVDAYVKSVAAAAVNEWIAENITNLPVMTSDLKKALIRDYKEQFEDMLNRELFNDAEKRAWQTADRIIEEAVESLDVPEHIVGEDPEWDEIEDRWQDE